MIEDIRHNCGLCVAHSLHDVYNFVKSLQHRGREAAGIACIGESRIDVVKWRGPVGTFDYLDLGKLFPGNNYHTYMAHVRYATRGRKDEVLADAHPHTIGGTVIDQGSHILISNCDVAGVHNGQVNDSYLADIDRRQLRTGCDTEALLHFFSEKGEYELLRKIPGSYTIAIADKRRKDVLVFRDQKGIKPGVLGMKDGKYCVASEDIALRKNGGDFIEDLQPGVIYALSPDGGYSKTRVVEASPRFCFFEYNYIADVDSILEGVSVRVLREALGEMLAQEIAFRDANLVTYLPRCPEVAARRYADVLGIKFMPVFYKMRAERAFQGSTLEDRKSSISQNLYIMPGVMDELKDKTVVSVDDSTIRGNNSIWERKLFYEMAKVSRAIHLNYTPMVGIIGEDDNEPRGCENGVDMPPNDNFVARGRTQEEISAFIGMQTHFLSFEGMLKGFEKVGIPRDRLCTFCIGGKRPF
jgi:amidophosphoribosyltransferase